MRLTVTAQGKRQEIDEISSRWPVSSIKVISSAVYRTEGIHVGAGHREVWADLSGRRRRRTNTQASDEVQMLAGELKAELASKNELLNYSTANENGSCTGIFTFSCNGVELIVEAEDANTSGVLGLALMVGYKWPSDEIKIKEEVGPSV